MAYIVSGAGDTAWNGTYNSAGTANGFPYFQIDSFHLLFNNGVGDWLLSDSLANADEGSCQYSFRTSNTTPVGVSGTDWEEGLGSSPPPSVALAGGGTSHLGYMFLGC